MQINCCCRDDGKRLGTIWVHQKSNRINNTQKRVKIIRFMHEKLLFIRKIKYEKEFE